MNMKISEARKDIRKYKNEKNHTNYGRKMIENEKKEIFQLKDGPSNYNFKQGRLIAHSGGILDNRIMQQNVDLKILRPK